MIFSLVDFESFSSLTVIPIVLSRYVTYSIKSFLFKYVFGSALFLPYTSILLLIDLTGMTRSVFNKSEKEISSIITPSLTGTLSYRFPGYKLVAV